MIKLEKEYSQNFDLETQRVILSDETKSFYLFGIKVFSFSYKTKEKQIEAEETKIGFR